MTRKPSVTVDFRRGRLFVVPQWSPGPGTYIDKGPVSEVSPTDPEGIGNAVFDAIRLFEWDDSRPLPNWSTYPKYVVDAAGLSTWGEFRQGLVDCSIGLDDNLYHIYTERPHILLPLDVTAEQMGHAILEALGTSVEKERRLAARRAQRRNAR